MSLGGPANRFMGERQLAIQSRVDVAVCGDRFWAKAGAVPGVLDFGSEGTKRGTRCQGSTLAYGQRGAWGLRHRDGECSVDHCGG